MKQLYKILIAYLLVSQASVDATIDILNVAYQMIYSFANRDATIIDGYIGGYIEYANPPDACAAMAHPFFVPDGRLKNMVLINGTDECDFMTKIQNAKAVGFEVAVLFDPFPGPFNYSDMIFPIPSSEINMSVVLVSSEDGISIRENYLYPQSSKWRNVILVISPTLWRQYTIYVVLIIMAIVVCCMASVLLYTVVRYAWKKCAPTQNAGENTDDPPDTSDEEMSENLEHETSERALSNLRRRFPSIEFSEGDSYEVCAICFSDFQVGEKLRVLNCSHAYHAECIDNWLLHKGTKRICPLCKDNVNLDNSVELPSSDASDHTPLLTSTNDPRSAVPNNGLTSVHVPNSSRYANRSSASDIRNHLVEVLGSVNSGNDSVEGTPSLNV